MELRQLEQVVAVAQARHFTRAAGDLTISQSGLSASVRALERELHTTLFVRNTRRVDLTEARRALLAESRRILAGAAAARERSPRPTGCCAARCTSVPSNASGSSTSPALLAKFPRRLAKIQATLLVYLRAELEVPSAGGTGTPCASGFPPR